jgi:hypothetical protein
MIFNDLIGDPDGDANRIYRQLCEWMGLEENDPHAYPGGYACGYSGCDDFNGHHGRDREIWLMGYDDGREDRLGEQTSQTTP